ncbi:hypothetical protein KR018_000727, partial [Drosophila ironensis]
KMAFVVKLIQRLQLSHSQRDVKPFIYVRSSWLEDKAEMDFLTTFDGQNYRGTLLYDEIKSAATELDQNYEEFFEECKNALTTHMGLPGFDYEICEKNGEQVFKLFKCQGYEILYAEVALRKISNCFHLLDGAIESAQKEASQAPPNTETTESQGGSISIKEYEQYVRDSKHKETEMLQKFLLLINSKKAHIRRLESQLEERSQEREREREREQEESDEEEIYGAATEVMTLDNPSP